jgi:uncharacterized membrane protein
MVKKYFVYVMGTVYIAAGLNHFWHQAFYMNIMPGYIPYPLAMVYISGVAEILLGAGLLFPATRKVAAWGIVALLVAISPVHVNMVLHPENYSNIPLLALYARLALQFVLIWLAYIYTKE